MVIALVIAVILILLLGVWLYIRYQNGNTGYLWVVLSDDEEPQLLLDLDQPVETILKKQQITLRVKPIKPNSQK